MKKFYADITDVESIIVELNSLDLSDKEKTHLAELVDANLHHTILDAVLSELPEGDKEKFLEHVSSGDNEKIWEFLNSRVDKIEEKIKIASEDLKTELHKDIKEAKEKK